MAKRQGIWADLQRERAQRQRMEQQFQRSHQQLANQVQRRQERADRDAARAVAANERERKRLYIEQRQAEADYSSADLHTRVEALENLLAASASQPLTFASFKRDFRPPPFDSLGLDTPSPAPEWAEFSPRPPRGLRRMLGGAARYERECVDARDEHERRLADHAQAEAERQRRLAELRTQHDRQTSQHAEEARRYNDEVDQFESDFRAGKPEAVAQFFTLVLDATSYPEGFPHRSRIIYRPEPKELVIDYVLPGQEVIPLERGYRYIQKRDALEPLPRPPKEIKDRYASVIAQVALRTLRDVFLTDGPEAVVESATFSGCVETKDKATGRPINPYLLSLGCTRAAFSELVLTDLDPVVCVKHRLGALLSPHPYDLEAVRPVVNFDELLKQFAFVEGMDAAAGLDSRPDLLEMSPTEFEHLVRQLFEAMGMKSWVTRASRDDGVDATAINEDPIFGGLCIIQAKRYKQAVGVDAIRELAGTMEDKRATKGVLVTTAWVTRGGHEHADRHGRMDIIEYDNLKYLLKEHLGKDVLISLPKLPPKRS